MNNSFLIKKNIEILTKHKLKNFYSISICYTVFTNAEIFIITLTFFISLYVTINIFIHTLFGTKKMYNSKEYEQQVIYLFFECYTYI